MKSSDKHSKSNKKASGVRIANAGVELRKQL